MVRFFQAFIAAFVVAAICSICLPATTRGQTQLDLIKLPAGFEISVYAQNVPGARSMTLGPGGTLIVGSRRAGRVYAVVDQDRDYKADQVITIASNYNMPNGVAFRGADLYVAEVNRILIFKDIEKNLTKPPQPEVVYDRFPTDRAHGWKYIAFGPDGYLYVPVGAPCNICDQGDPYASIMRFKPGETEPEIFARGVRNTVGFDWHPQTKELWFTDNGRDWMGDDQPPDELNHAPEKGLHFGYPYCHGKSHKDPKFGQDKDCGDFRPPALELGPHVAALGMKFYTGTMFPEAYRNRIFMAEHGSWNRSVPIGYRITTARVNDGKASDYEVFAEGWLSGNAAWGRPVDVLVLPDGSMLVSDDRAGAIYRITYQQ
jgi:glucose/arabinose dehydrogenase